MTLSKWIALGMFLCCEAGGAATIGSIPFELVDGLVYIPVSVNGSAPLPFVLDTGASYTVLSPQTAKALAVEATGTAAAAGPGRGGSATMAMADGVDIRVGDIDLKTQKVAILPVAYISSQGGHPTAGILSVHAFSGRPIQVDYAARTIRFPDVFVPGKEDKEVPFVLADNVPFVHADVSLTKTVALSGRFVLDSGLVGTIIFSKPFLTKHPEFRSLENRVDLPAVEAVGGTMRLQAATIAALRIGSVVIANPLAVFSVDGAGILDTPGVDGIIGSYVLRQFLVTYDYPHNRLFLSPPPTKADRTGESGG